MGADNVSLQAESVQTEMTSATAARQLNPEYGYQKNLLSPRTRFGQHIKVIYGICVLVVVALACVITYQAAIQKHGHDHDHEGKRPVRLDLDEGDRMEKLRKELAADIKENMEHSRKMQGLENKLKELTDSMNKMSKDLATVNETVTKLAEDYFD